MLINTKYVEARDKVKRQYEIIPAYDASDELWQIVVYEIRFYIANRIATGVLDRSKIQEDLC